MNHPISLSLWFDRKAKDAANFYCSVFPDTKKAIGKSIIYNIVNKQKLMLFNIKIFIRNPSIPLLLACKISEKADQNWIKIAENISILFHWILLCGTINMSISRINMV
jgi:hypothetical protein